MDEAGEVAAGRPVLEVELVLAQPEPGARRVDGHPDLHPVAAGEGQGRPQDLGPHRPLARDRRRRLQPAEPADRPAGEAEGDAEAAAEPAAEGGHREVALPRLDRLEQHGKPGGRVAEVAVAEEDRRGRGLDAQRRLGGSGHVGSLAVRAPAADDLGAGGQRRLGGPVLGGVVGDIDPRPGQLPAQCGDRERDPVGLVAGGDDRRRRPGGPHGRCIGNPPLRRHAGIFSRRWLRSRRHPSPPMGYERTGRPT